MPESFMTLLSKTSKAFDAQKIGGYTSTTRYGVRFRIDKIDRKRELIMRICEELESQLEEELDYAGIKDPYHLGFEKIVVQYATSKDDLDENADHHTIILKPDIWEKASRHKYKPSGEINDEK